MGGIRSEQIYEALFDNEALEQLSQRLADAVGGRSSILNWRHHDGGYEALSYCYFAPDFMEAYVEAWATLDPWVIAGRQPAVVNQVVLLDELVPSSTYARSAIYNDFIRAWGDDTFHTMGVVVSTDWGDGVIGVNRGRKARAFEADELARLQRYARDVGRVLTLRGELAAARRAKDVSCATLDTMAVAVAVVAWNGRLVEANEAAETVFERADGLFCRAGVIGAVSHGDGAGLEHAIALATAASQPTAASVVVTRRAHMEPYLVTASPLVTPSTSRCAMLIFRDPETRDPSLTGRLRGLFSLSKAEAEIAIDLAEGRSPAEVAARRLVTANTLKTQLASLMGKMGCTRQSEVVSVIAALPPVRNG